MELMKVNDLEDKIMKVWNTTDDIDLLLNWISDHVLIYDVESDADEDELMNLIIGIKGLHHQRCHALFKDFEKVLANSKRTENSRHERAPGESGRDMSSDDEIGRIATAVANGEPTQTDEDTVAATLARASDGEDFTTYASVTAYTGDVNVSPPEWT